MNKNIGLALSGGGIRAVMFHLGVLRFLAENNLLEEIKYLSSVSGGSLLIGLLYQHSNYKWPNSKDFIENVYPKIKNTILNTSIEFSSIWRLLISPWYWFDRSKIVRNVLKSKWGIEGDISNIPQDPVWAINCSTLETGNRWRIKDKNMGDYGIGYSNLENFHLADAIAISAAFPMLIGSYKLKTKTHKWHSYKTKENISIPYSKLHLIDGGVYDNLGLEPLFDVSKKEIKKSKNIDYIIVSDAGAPLLPKILSWFDLIRFFDVIYENVRKLRVRLFVGMITQEKNGLYLKIGRSRGEMHRNALKNNFTIPQKCQMVKQISDDEVKRIKKYSTRLWKPSEKGFKMIEQNGYDVAYTMYYIYNQ